MGRPLTPYACDNCIPGDASGWHLPLALLVVACGAGAASLWLRSGRRDGWRAGLLRLAGLVLLAGPPVGVFGVASDITYAGAHCGSALSASLLRGWPEEKSLDPVQRGCQEKGERHVALAYAWSGGTFVLAAVLGAVGAVPARRRPALAA